MKGYRNTNVFEINGKLVVADTIEDAIVVFREWATDVEIRRINQVKGNAYEAVIAESEKVTELSKIIKNK